MLLSRLVFNWPRWRLRLEKCVLKYCVFWGFRVKERHDWCVNTLCKAAYGRMIHEEVGQSLELSCAHADPWRTHKQTEDSDFAWYTGPSLSLLYISLWWTIKSPSQESPVIATRNYSIFINLFRMCAFSSPHVEKSKQVSMSLVIFGWNMSWVSLCTTCLKSSSLPPIDGSPLKELVMTSPGRKLCSLVSCGVFGSAYSTGLKGQCWRSVKVTGTICRDG